MNSPKELLEFRRLSGMEITKEHRVLAEAEEALEELEALWQEIGEGLGTTEKDRGSAINNWAASARHLSKVARDQHKVAFQKNAGQKLHPEDAAKLHAAHDDAIHASGEAADAHTAAAKRANIAGPTKLGDSHLRKAKRFTQAAALHTQARGGVIGGERMVSEPDHAKGRAKFKPG